jgi:sorting nexin-29
MACLIGLTILQNSPDDIDAFNLFPQPSDLLTSISSHLNNKFTMSEILTALDDALAGKSAGVDGIPVDFIKYAVQVNNKGAPDEYCIHILAGHITYLFNKILIDGYPSSWSTNALTPVPKPKGCPEFKDDYRGIAVSAGLAKLYSMVLLRRLDTWAEVNGHRAKGQAGFRQKRGTPDNAFILNHVIEKYKAQSKPVYAVFIDFRKAYDSIIRPILWESLRSLGLHGSILDTLMAMYK